MISGHCARVTRRQSSSSSLPPASSSPVPRLASRSIPHPLFSRTVTFACAARIFAYSSALLVAPPAPCGTACVASSRRSRRRQSRASRRHRVARRVRAARSRRARRLAHRERADRGAGDARASRASSRDRSGGGVHRARVRVSTRARRGPLVASTSRANSPMAVDSDTRALRDLSPGRRSRRRRDTAITDPNSPIADPNASRGARARTLSVDDASAPDRETTTPSSRATIERRRAREG